MTHRSGSRGWSGIALSSDKERVGSRVERTRSACIMETRTFVVEEEL